MGDIYSRVVSDQGYSAKVSAIARRTRSRNSMKASFQPKRRRSSISSRSLAPRLNYAGNWSIGTAWRTW